MALYKNKTSFGIHSFTAINKTTGLPYGSAVNDNGIVKVLGSANLEPNSSDVALTGGSFAGPIDVQRGEFDPQVSLTVKETPNWIYELAGYTVTENAAEANGGTENFSNKLGTSVFDATTGIATVTVKSGSEADLKNGVYLIKAASATTVDVYAVTDGSFLKGTDVDYQNGTLLIVSGLTITTGAATEITGLGVEMTGGSGTIGMTTDDVALVEVRAANDSSDILVMPSSPCPVRFEAYLYGQQCNDGSIMALHAPNCELQAFPLNFNEREFSTSDIVIRPLLDTSTSSYWKVLRTNQ